MYNIQDNIKKHDDTYNLGPDFWDFMVNQMLPIWLVCTHLTPSPVTFCQYFCIGNISIH